MLWSILTTFFNTAFASCPIQEKYSTDKIHTISEKQLSTIFEHSKGCLTIVELWASWCGPCVEIAPQMALLHHNYPEALFLPISVDATEHKAAEFWKEHPSIGPKIRLQSWSLKGLKNEYDRIGAHFPGALPYIVVLSHNGQLLYEVYEPTSLDKLEMVIKSYHPSQSVEEK